MPTNLVEGNQGRPGGHAGCLCASVDPALRVRLEQAILNLQALVVRGGAP